LSGIHTSNIPFQCVNGASVKIRHNP
jgi:hypothetical protein